MTRKALSLVLWFHNDEKSVQRQIKKGFDLFKEFGISGELIVVDDASTDGTRRELEQIGKRNRIMKIIRNSSPLGAEASLALGGEMALGQKCLMISNIDILNISAFMPHFSKKSSADVVLFASRTRGVGLWNRILEIVSKSGSALLFGVSLSSFSSPQLWTREALRKVLPRIRKKGLFLGLLRLKEALRQGFAAEEITLPALSLSDVSMETDTFSEDASPKRHPYHWKIEASLLAAVSIMSLFAYQRNSSALGLGLIILAAIIALDLCAKAAEPQAELTENKRPQTVLGPGKAVLGFGLIVVAFFVIRWSWITRNDLSDTLVAIFGFSFLSVVLYGWPLSFLETFAQMKNKTSDPIASGWGRTLMLLLGSAALLIVWKGSQVASTGLWNIAGLYFLGAYLAIRFLRGWSAVWIIPKSLEWSLLGLVLFAAMVFRFYQIGEIPVGMHVPDEKLILEHSRRLLENSARPTLMSSPHYTGAALPTYVCALSLKVFGDSIWGYRMGGAILGLLVVLLVYIVAKGLLGAWPAICSAGVAAVELYPVAMDRMQYLTKDAVVLLLITVGGLVWGLRLRRPWLFAIAGISMSANFLTYHAGRGIILMIPVLVALYYYFHRSSIRGNKNGWMAFACSFFISLAPLVLWIAVSPSVRLRHYMKVVVNPASWIVSPGLQAKKSFLEKCDAYAAQLVDVWPDLLNVFISRGPHMIWQFVPNIPVISFVSFVAIVLGLVTCLVRFRTAGYAYLPLWLFIGLIPGLITSPGTIPDVRRCVMAMPALFMLAGLGLSTVSSGLVYIFNGRAKNTVQTIALLVFMAWIGQACWQNYFIKINMSAKYLDATEANQVSVARAVHRQNLVDPIYVISFKHPIQENPLVPLIPNHDWSMRAVNPTVPYRSVWYPHRNRNGYGLLEALSFRSGSARAEGKLTIILSSFYFYLEELLVDVIGGKIVSQVPLAKGYDEASKVGQGILPSKDWIAKLVQIPDMGTQELEDLKKTRGLNLTFEELIAPPRLGGHRYVMSLYPFSTKMHDLIRKFRANPAEWKVRKKTQTRLVDPYFWTLRDQIPGKIHQPLRMKFDWILEVPEDGVYSIGINSSLYTAVKIDGKEILLFLPTREEVLEAREGGFWGQSIQLTRGAHRISGEQLMMNFNTTLLFDFRLLWRKANGDITVLPPKYLKNN